MAAGDAQRPETLEGIPRCLPTNPVQPVQRCVTLGFIRETATDTSGEPASRQRRFACPRATCMPDPCVPTWPVPTRSARPAGRGIVCNYIVR